MKGFHFLCKCLTTPASAPTPAPAPVPVPTPVPILTPVPVPALVPAPSSLPALQPPLPFPRYWLLAPSCPISQTTLTTTHAQTAATTTHAQAVPNPAPPLTPLQLFLLACLLSAPLFSQRKREKKLENVNIQDHDTKMRNLFSRDCIAIN